MEDNNMQLEFLISEQQRLEIYIEDQAEKTKIAKADFKPIKDGVADLNGYLNSNLKVAWILKEPWDDEDANHRPKGGGWSLINDCFNHLTLESHKKNPVWQKVAYVMYGFRNNQKWHDMPWIRNKPEMLNEIRSIAWLNASKMPGGKVSSDRYIRNEYNETWHPVLQEQLKVYKPDVIIFGKTFQHFYNEFENKLKIDKYCNQFLDFYVASNQILIDTYHPGRKGGAYVDALIEALTYAQKELKK